MNFARERREMKAQSFKGNMINQNPRIGVLLGIYQPCQRTVNVLWPFRLKGLKWLQQHWPEERMRRSLRGYGPKTSREWNGLLKARHGLPAKGAKGAK